MPGPRQHPLVAHAPADALEQKLQQLDFKAVSRGEVDVAAFGRT